jgi:hypothetical protein
LKQFCELSLKPKKKAWLYYAALEIRYRDVELYSSSHEHLYLTQWSSPERTCHAIFSDLKLTQHIILFSCHSTTMGKAGRKHFMPGEQMAEYWKESVECGPEEPVIERLKEDSVEQRTGGDHGVAVQHRRADQEREGE